MPFFDEVLTGFRIRTGQKDVFLSLLAIVCLENEKDEKQRKRLKKYILKGHDELTAKDASDYLNKLSSDTKVIVLFASLSKWHIIRWFFKCVTEDTKMRYQGEGNYTVINDSEVGSKCEKAIDIMKEMMSDPIYEPLMDRLGSYTSIDVEIFEKEMKKSIKEEKIKELIWEINLGERKFWKNLVTTYLQFDYYAFYEKCCFYRNKDIYENEIRSFLNKWFRTIYDNEFPEEDVNEENFGKFLDSFKQLIQSSELNLKKYFQHPLMK